MYPYWNSLIQPLLALQEPRVMVEIGSERGTNLKNLLAFAIKHDALVHAIDPKPLFDADQWQDDYKGRLVVHCDTSLAVIPKLEGFDTFFIDGDHNWYTVFHELKAIESRAEELSISFPLVLLHDIGWPWGRRDLYYDPDSIPEEFRQPFQKPAQEKRTRAYHDNFCKAMQEGGPRNGVLTAVEDFLKESKLQVDLLQIPGFAGLGILVPAELRKKNKELADYITGLELAPPMRRYIEHLEYYRSGRHRAPSTNES